MKAHIAGTIKRSELRAAISNELDQAFQDGKSTAVNICAIALNEKFGFGRDRLNRLNDEINSIIDEYNGLAELREGIANEKIQQRLKQIGVDA